MWDMKGYKVYKWREGWRRPSKCLKSRRLSSRVHFRPPAPFLCPTHYPWIKTWSSLGFWNNFGMVISVWDGSQVSTIPFQATSTSSCAQLTILGVKQKNYKFTKITKSSQVHFRQAAFAQLTILWLKSSLNQWIRVRIKYSRNSNDHILTFFSHYRFPPLPAQARTIQNIFSMNNLEYEDEKHRRVEMRWKHEQRLNGIYHQDHVLQCQTILNPQLSQYMHIIQTHMKILSNAIFHRDLCM